jgi:hypothetical protein
MTQRASAWLPPLSLVAIALLVSLLSFAYRIVPLAVTGQLALLLMLVRGFALWPPMARLFAGMPTAHRLVFALLLGAMVLGHYTLNGRTYFPFVAWEIFSFVREEDPVTCREFIATTARGAQVRLLAEQLFPSIVQIDPVDSFPPDKTEHLARAMAREYNVLHPADPVRRVELMRMAVPLRLPPGVTMATPPCEFLKRYDISSDRSN